MAAVAGGGDLAAADGEVLRGLDRIQAGLGQQLPEPLGLAPSGPGDAALALAEQALDLGEAAPAVSGKLDVEGAFGRPQVFQPGGEIGELGVQAGPFGRKIGEQPVHQPGLEVGEVVPQRGSLRGQRR